MGPPTAPPAHQVCRALGDAWVAHGRLLAPTGGEVTEIDGARLMASGVAQPHLNGGEVTDPAAVDIGFVRRWYGDRAVSDWGMRVPTALAGAWPWGRHVLTQVLLVLTPGAFDQRGGAGAPGAGAPDPDPAGVTLRTADPTDIETVVRIDAAAFGEPAWASRAWIRPLLDTPDAAVVLAHLGGQPAGTGYCLVTDDQAGPAAFVGGVGTRPGARRRGVGTTVSRRAVAMAFAAGAAFAHLHATTDHAADIYRRLGFVEVASVEIFVDC